MDSRPAKRRRLELGRVDQSIYRIAGFAYDQCLFRIFTYLPIVDRIRVQRVCKRWQYISKTLWRDMRILNSSDSWTIPGRCLSLTLPQLEQTLRLCGNFLTHLDFSRDQKTNEYHVIEFQADEKFFTLLRKWCPNLKIIDIYWMEPTPEGIRYLAENFNKFIDFRVRVYDEMCIKALSILLNNSKDLRSLKLYGTTNDEILHSLPMETLEALYCSPVYDFETHYLPTILKQCHKLKVLEICVCISERSFVHEIWEAICTRAENLEILTLTFYEHKLLNLFDLAFPKFDKLHTLHLSMGTNVNNKLLETIGEKCKFLKSAYFECSEKLTDKGFMNLGNLHCLEIANLPKVKGMFLIVMEKLKKLSIRNCQKFKSSSFCLLLEARDLQIIEISLMKKSWTSEVIDYVQTDTKNRQNNQKVEVIVNFPN